VRVCVCTYMEGEQFQIWKTISTHEDLHNFAGAQIIISLSLSPSLPLLVSASFSLSPSVISLILSLSLSPFVSLPVSLSHSPSPSLFPSLSRSRCLSHFLSLSHSLSLSFSFSPSLSLTLALALSLVISPLALSLCMYMADDQSTP